MFQLFLRARAHDLIRHGPRVVLRMAEVLAV